MEIRLPEDVDLYKQQCISFLEHVVKEMVGHYPRGVNCKGENTSGVDFAYIRTLCFDSHVRNPLYFCVGYAYYGAIGLQLIDVIRTYCNFQGLNLHKQADIDLVLRRNCFMMTRVIDKRVVVVLEFDNDPLTSKNNTAKDCAEDLWYQLKSVLFVK